MICVGYVDSVMTQNKRWFLIIIFQWLTASTAPTWPKWNERSFKATFSSAEINVRNKTKTVVFQCGKAKANITKWYVVEGLVPITVLKWRFQWIYSVSVGNCFFLSLQQFGFHSIYHRCEAAATPTPDSRDFHASRIWPPQIMGSLVCYTAQRFEIWPNEVSYTFPPVNMDISALDKLAAASCKQKPICGWGRMPITLCTAGARPSPTWIIFEQ